MSAVQNLRRRGQGAPMTGSSYTKEPENENRVVPNKYLKNVGDRMRFRILDLTSDSCVTLRTKTYKSKGFGKMASQMMPTDLHWQMYKGEGRTEDDLIKGHDFDDPSLVVHMYQLDDSIEKLPLNQIGVYGENKVGQENTIYRIPAFLYEVEKASTTPKGKSTVEPIDNTVFLEVGWGIFKQLTELQETQGGIFALDFDTLAPEYDIYLVRNNSQGADTWKVEGIKSIKDSSGKWVDQENYNILSEDVFGDRFDEIWDSLTGPIYESMTSDFMTMESIKYKIGPRKKAAGDATTPIASTPLLNEDPVVDKTNRRGTTPEPTQDEPVDDGTNGDDPEEGQTVKFGASARAGRRR